MLFPLRQNFVVPASAFALALSCTWLLSNLQVPKLRELTAPSQPLSPAQMQEQLTAERTYLNITGSVHPLGYDNLIADWIFLRFLQYFGDDPVREVTGYSLSPEYFSVILKLDPRFLTAYYYLSASTTLYAGLPERTIGLMEEKLKLLSPKVPERAYYLWRLKAIDELLFLGDSKAAKRSFEMAAKWASQYSDPESRETAFWSQRTAAYLARKPNSKLAQVNAWTMFLGNAIDDRSRRMAISRIRLLGGDVVKQPNGQVKVIPPKED